MCFNLAMQARVDEHTSDSHLKMSFIEFMEAIARAAEYLSLGAPSDNIREAYKEFLHEEKKSSKSPEKAKEEPVDEDQEFLENEEGAFMSKEEHVNQLLHKKIEHLIPYLLAYCTTISFKKKWKWPRKNPHTGLFTDVKEQGVKEVKFLIVKGINKMIISRFNLKEIVKKKGLSIKLKNM